MADEEEYNELEDTLQHFLLHVNSSVRKLEKVSDVDSLQQFIFSVRRSYQKDTVDDVEFLRDRFPDVENLVDQLVEELENINEEIENPEEEDGMSQQDVAKYKRSLQNRLKALKQVFEPFLSKRKDLASLVKTEKVPLSKFPPGVSDEIASYLSGEEGSIESQMNRIRAQSGKPPLPPKKGSGKKTKKNRSRRKKTHGRRV